MDDADAGRHDLEAVERLHAPLQELVARAVAPELDLHVQRAARRALDHSSTCTEWSTTRSTGTSGSMTPGSRPRPGDGGAHRGEVDEQRHAGEVLQDDAGDDEGDSAVRSARGFQPARAGRRPA